jgi:hypothetical protein
MRVRSVRARTGEQCNSPGYIIIINILERYNGRGDLINGPLVVYVQYSQKPSQFFVE